MIQPVDALSHSFLIHRDLSVTAAARPEGAPLRIDGMVMGIVTMEHSAPHGGEVHPDGDEILYVISGKARVIGESAPDDPLEMGPGDACIVRAGEWHRVEILEKTQLIHVTAGPNGDHRPLAADPGDAAV
ncbi:MAG: cupin domain-containing protein [Xanthomonadales bacterium]|nr:cupin domain-containing protein [Xanthomonadales bacterium]